MKLSTTAFIPRIHIREVNEVIRIPSLQLFFIINKCPLPAQLRANSLQIVTICRAQKNYVFKSY